MDQTDTNSQPKLPARKTVEEWAQLKETKRWLLCLAATFAGWLPEQEDDAQDEVTETEFDAAVEAAREAYERCEGSNQRVEGARERGTVRAICHPSAFAGVIVRRLPPTEVKAMQKALGKQKTDEDAGGSLGDYFKGVVLWPEPKHVERLRQRMPQAVEIVLPMRWLQSLGADGGDRVKKR